MQNETTKKQSRGILGAGQQGLADNVPDQRFNPDDNGRLQLEAYQDKHPLQEVQITKKGRPGKIYDHTRAKSKSKINFIKVQSRDSRYGSQTTLF